MEEKHLTSSEFIKDIVIGVSDGLTVPFALAAGLSGAVSNTGIITTAGIAEIVAGSIAGASPKFRGNSPRKWFNQLIIN